MLSLDPAMRPNSGDLIKEFKNIRKYINPNYQPEVEVSKTFVDLS